ncbi:MAG: hypothetical protein HOE90_05020 [Bacteriovoracaceae bacterium]|jgi:O-antigen/teichoic acid export membrane protein|nr:hypothetical protein [Bacteriovoracaceae bacterium]
MVEKLVSQSRNKKALILSAGKLVSFVLTFFVPIFLSRYLLVEEYGSYKQVVLIWILSYQVFGLGIDQGLFFFMKQAPEDTPIYALNVLFFNTVSVAILMGIGFLFTDQLSSFLDNPTIKDIYPSFFFLVLVSLPSQHFEHYLMVLDKIKLNLIVQIVSEVSKSIIIVGLYYFYKDLKIVIQGLICFYSLRLLVLILFNVNMIKQMNLTRSYQHIFSTLKAQIRYGLPIGFSKISEAFLSYDKLIISSFFSLRTFTMYSVGCFDIPFLPSMANTYLDLMAVDMLTKKGIHSDALKIWKDVISKIFLILIIPVVFLFFYADEFFVLIFSKKYLNSSPIFRLYLINFILISMNAEVLYRVFNEGKKLAALYGTYVFSSVIAVSIGAYLGNIYFCLIGKFVCTIMYSLMLLKDAKGFFKTDFKELLPWGEMGITFASVITAGIVSRLIVTAAPISNGFTILVIGGSIFSILVAVILNFLGILPIVSFLKRRYQIG